MLMLGSMLLVSRGDLFFQRHLCLQCTHVVSGSRLHHNRSDKLCICWVRHAAIWRRPIYLADPICNKYQGM